MTAARGVLCIDLSPYVDRDGWQTVEAWAHVSLDGDVEVHRRLVSVDVGSARRLDDRVVRALVERLAGASVEVRGTYAGAVDTLVEQLNVAKIRGV